MSKTRSTMDKRSSQLPGWLWPTSNTLPPLYKRIWEAVKEDRLTLGVIAGELLVDTNKVFPLLLTSQLPTEVLGYIWSLANQKYAGQLTEQELYIVLALTAIAQTSYAFNNLEVLHMLPGPPIPRLNLNILQPNVPQAPAVVVEEKHESRSHMHTYHQTIIPSSLISTSYIGETRIDPKPSTNSPDVSDDFSDFQSAPIPTTTPIIPMWDSKQGSAIGSRLANHNLSGTKKLVEKKKVSTNKNNPPVNSIRNISINNSPQSTKERSPERLFSKCNLKNQPNTVILKDTAIRSEPTMINFKEIVPEKPSDITKPSKVSSPKTAEPSTNDLMNLTTVEDKYSALRVLVDDSVATPVASLSPETNADDFGDFISAEQSELTNFEVIDTTLDLFSDFEQFLPSANDKSQISFTQETIEAFAQLEITASPEKTINFLEEKYEVTIDPEKVIVKEDTVSENSVELNNGSNAILPRSGSVPSLDLKSFLSANVEDDKERETMNQLIYWEWKQYMESCVLLLQVAANIFTNITSEVVLTEVLNSAQGYNFLCNLAEVAAVCRRVNFSHKEMDINIMGFDDLLMEIDRIWAEMEPFYVSIPIVTELPVWPIPHQGEGTSCALCLTVITSGKVTANDNIYHATCANLWLNCVNSNLPALKYVHHGQAITAGSSQIL